MRIEWASHNERLAPRQQDYKPTRSPTPGDEQRKYKFTTNNGQVFEELKVQSRTKMKQPKTATILENIVQKSALTLFLKSIYTPSQNPSFPNGSHIAQIK